MGYIDDHLLPGERVTYRAHRHWLIFSWAALFIAVAIVALILFSATTVWPEGRWIVPLGALLLALGFGVGPLIQYATSEFAVTDKRVVTKFGLVQRDSHETLLSKIEAIGVDQTLLGRILDYGTVTIVGTGGTREPFPLIAAPLEFRRQVQTQIVAIEERHTVAPPAAAVAAAVAEAPRVERECPFCAERILARAKVCRYCGRGVEPTA